MPNAPDIVTLDGIRLLFEQLRDSSEKRAELDKRLDDLFFNAHAVEVVESPVMGVVPEVLRMGRVPASVNMIEGLFDVYPIYTALPFGTGVPAKTLADRVEKFLNAVVKQAERERREDTYGLNRQDTLRFGRSFTVFYLATNYWSGYPKRNRGKSRQSDTAYNKETEEFKIGAPLPFVIRHIPIGPTEDRISAYPLLAAGEMLRFIWVHKMEVAEIIHRFGYEGQGRRPDTLEPLRSALKDPAIVKLTDQLTVLEYFDSKRVAYVMMDAKFEGILREWKHDLVDVPVVMTEGIITGDPSPERRWKAIYHDAQDVVLHEDRLASRQATNIRINYYKSFFALEEETSQEGASGEIIEFEPGKLTLLHGVKEFGAVDTETAMQEAQLLEAKLERMLESHLLPSVLMGVQGGGDEPAWGTNLRIRQAEKRFRTIGNHLAMGRVDLAKLILRGVMAIGERVYAIDDEDLEWSITPDEAKRFLNRIRVKIEPKTIVDRNADVSAAEGMERLKVPRRVYYEDTLGYEQPTDLMRERILEDLQFDPQSPLYAETVEGILRQAGLLDEKENAATDEEMMSAISGGEIDPAAAAALLASVGGNGAGGVPVEGGFIPTEPQAALPPEQVRMRTGRRQGSQPRPRRAPPSIQETGGSV